MARSVLDRDSAQREAGVGVGVWVSTTTSGVVRIEQQSTHLTRAHAKAVQVIKQCFVGILLAMKDKLLHQVQPVLRLARFVWLSPWTRYWTGLPCSCSTACLQTQCLESRRSERCWLFSCASKPIIGKFGGVSANLWESEVVFVIVVCFVFKGFGREPAGQGPHETRRKTQGFGRCRQGG